MYYKGLDIQFKIIIAISDIIQIYWIPEIKPRKGSAIFRQI